MSSENNRRTSDVVTIDTASILLDLKRHWWNILLMALAGALLAFSLGSYLNKTSYTSTAVLAALGNSTSAVSNVENAAKLSDSVTSIVGSDVFKNVVTEEIGSSAYTLTASYISDTNLISIQASAATPQLAFMALRSALENYPALLSNLMSDLYMVTVQQPTVALTPANTMELSTSVALGAALLALFYIAMVVLFSVLRDTVKNSSDVRHKVDTRLLGTIPFLKSKKKNDASSVLATAADKDFRFEENYQLVANRIMTAMDQTNAKTLMVTSALQNEGKTHCVLNIAYSIAKSQKRVLVIDCDFRNPSLAATLQVEDTENASALATALKTGEFSEEMLYHVPDTEVYCLSNKERHGSSNRSLSDGTFVKLMEQARSKFDYVLVDSGPVVLVADTALIASFCDASVLLVAQDGATIRAINDAVDMLDRNGELVGCVYRETRPTGKRMGYGYGYGYGSSYGYGYGESKKAAKEVQ